MLDYKNLVQLAKAAAMAKKNAPVAYSFNGKDLSTDAVNATLYEELDALTATHAAFRDNKNTVYSILEEVITDVLPKKVEEKYDQFAEVRVVKQGDSVKFVRRLGERQRAKQFITRVGLAGVYEVFKLSGGQRETFEVKTSAIGGAIQIGIEELLDRRITMAELLDVVLEGMDELISKEINHSLKASINQLPVANRVVADGFDEVAFDTLLTIASGYGTPVIYCTYEFAVKMIPQEAWRYTENMKTQLWEQGRFTTYKNNTKVVILEQGFEDETNERKVIDPGYAWIIPTGADGKPVKVVFEGETVIEEFKNRDMSTEIQMYKKVGVATLLSNNICAYVDTSLLGQMNTWHLDGVTGKVITYDGRLSGTEA